MSVHPVQKSLIDTWVNSYTQNPNCPIDVLETRSIAIDLQDLKDMIALCEAHNQNAIRFYLVRQDEPQIQRITNGEKQINLVGVPSVLGTVNSDWFRNAIHPTDIVQCITPVALAENGGLCPPNC